MIRSSRMSAWERGSKPPTPAGSLRPCGREPGNTAEARVSPGAPTAEASRCRAAPPPRARRRAGAPGPGLAVVPAEEPAGREPGRRCQAAAAWSRGSPLLTHPPRSPSRSSARFQRRRRGTAGVGGGWQCPVPVPCCPPPIALPRRCEHTLAGLRLRIPEALGPASWVPEGPGPRWGLGAVARSSCLPALLPEECAPRRAPRLADRNTPRSPFSGRPPYLS